MINADLSNIRADNLDAKVAEIVSLVDQGNFQEAAKRSDLLVSKKPGNLDAWKVRGYSYMKLKNYDEAIKSFDESIRISPGDYFSNVNRAHCLVFKGKYSDAAKEFISSAELAGKFRPDQKAHLFAMASILFLLEKEDDSALESLTKSFATDPNLAVSDLQRIFEILIIPLPIEKVPAEAKLELQEKINNIHSRIKSRK